MRRLRYEGSRSQTKTTQSMPLKMVQVRQELDQRFIVVGARTQLEHEVGVTAIRFVHQRTGYGEPLPDEPVVQRWRLASRRPSRPHRGQQ